VDKTRNNCVIKGKFPRSLAEILFKINALLQKWKVLLRSGELSKLEEMAQRMDGSVPVEAERKTT